jgi:hypothetical protein
MLMTLVILSGATVVKIGDVQGLELLQLLWFLAALPYFVYRGLKIPTSGLWRQYGIRYLLFLGGCLAVSLLALRLTFYPPSSATWLKQPVILSISRLLELFVAMYFMVAIAGELRERPRLLRLALDTHCWAATLSACVSIGAWVLLKVARISTFPVYGYDDRVRGFFNEGGPYGVFLIGAALVALLRLRLFRPKYPFLYHAALGVLLAGVVLSGSKAAFLAAILLCGIGLLSAGSRTQRFALLGVSTVAVVLAVSLFQGKMYGYIYSYMNFDEALQYRPGDENLVMGRIAGALIVPRMIAAHPLVGIGLANYSLMRNDPDYLQGMPSVEGWDLPGMGMLGSAAELGVPLVLVFVALISRPLILARKKRAPAIVIMAAGFQPVALLLGVNLNFFYPWLIAAFATSVTEQ